jgi:hypothetical protein
MSMIEEWRPIVGYEGLYEVSSFGRVRSLDRASRDKNGLLKRFKGKILSICIRKNKYGQYAMVGLPLKDGSKNNTRYVAHLVLEAFGCLRPSGMECCHCDGNSLNNRIDNLRWDTPKENTKDKYRHGTVLWGSKNHQARLTEKQVLEIRAKYIRYSKTKSNSRQLADEYGVDIQTIGKIIRRERWKHI